MKNNLLEWAASNQMSYAQIGRDLFVSDTLISKVANKHRNPSPELRLRFLLKYGAGAYRETFGAPEGPEVKITEILQEDVNRD